MFRSSMIEGFDASINGFSPEWVIGVADRPIKDVLPETALRYYTGIEVRHSQLSSETLAALAVLRHSGLTMRELLLMDNTFYYIAGRQIDGWDAIESAPILVKDGSREFTATIERLYGTARASAVNYVSLESFRDFLTVAVPSRQVRQGGGYSELRPTDAGLGRLMTMLEFLGGGLGTVSRSRVEPNDPNYEGIYNLKMTPTPMEADPLITGLPNAPEDTIVGMTIAQIRTSRANSGNNLRGRLNATIQTYDAYFSWYSSANLFRGLAAAPESSRVTISEWRAARGAVMNRLNPDRVAKAHATGLEAFLKREKTPIQRAEFAGFDFNAPSGSRTSRTWGIEIEHVDTADIATPSGWNRHYDGSLRAVNYECDECDDCLTDPDDCDCNHHNASDGDEYDDDIEPSGAAISRTEPMEFVSPILRYVNSRGLRGLTTALRGRKWNRSAGIHVHVGAEDLLDDKVAQARLARNWALIAPLFDRIFNRNGHDYYAQKLPVRHIGTIMKAITPRKTVDKQREDLGEIISNYSGHIDFDDRYYQVNFEALEKHGTVEFRAMGPVYDYATLIRWAWVCREMANIAKIDTPVGTWAAVSDLEGLLKVLRKYGSENYAGK